MKRKAPSELSLAPSKRPSSETTQLPDPRLSPSRSPSWDGSDHDCQSDGDSAPSNHQSTLVTAPSTSSRRFPSDLKTIQCTYPNCDRLFNRPARLTAHLRSHTNDRAFKCTYPGCKKDYLEE